MSSVQEKKPLTATYTPLSSLRAQQRSRWSSQTKRYARGGAVLVIMFVFWGAIFTSMRALRGYDTSKIETKHAESFPGATDLITELYGKPDTYTSRLFSGYLPIGNGGQAFYFYAESLGEKPQQDPVLLWLNGGPGASSLAGCFSENGPLIVNDDSQSLRVNEHAWNTNANFLCIESPVGVGFSYNISGVYESDDLRQADELYLAVQQFFVKFPWLRENDFIISGESYGGVYVPTTAKRIVEGNLAGEAKINLKKFVVGNGANEFLSLSKVLYGYYHGLISTQEYEAIRSACPELKEFEPTPQLEANSICQKALSEYDEQVLNTAVNSYNVIGKCAGNPQSGIEKMVQELIEPMRGFPHPVAMTLGLCLNSTKLISYFNLPVVRQNMHTKLEIDHWSNIALTSASIDIAALAPAAGVDPQMVKHKVLGFNVTLGMVVTPLWKYLVEHDVQGVIYHGDADMQCDFIGGLWAVESLGLPRKQGRQAWTVTLDGSDQVAGFFEDFGPIQYVTVKGAGHMVPETNPIEAKKLLDLFVLDKQL
ncbi:hypothetical protein Poli38472_000672 [Pythium oligandrum]|uniref:Carboxypeptidase n=1 Tax=Pythium oligandrum TaxID=41045 RepID=A0A8K1FEK0_PYTOL|nr:hypothetical protein Poli38472_000672 [Pythium oligandrum]|eukprot:TMW60630.1 hypothetical protein Poli38472_000672 [Pythium oligandrum]